MDFTPLPAIKYDEERRVLTMSRETQKPTVRVVTPLQLFATSKTGQKYVIVATDPTGGKVIKDGKIK